MTNGNTVELAGNMTRDPEMRFTPSGAAVATFGIAVNRRWMNRKTNEWDEDVSFFDIVCWRELAENVTESLTKGTRIIVLGRLDQRTWETESGEKRAKVEIVADEIGPSLRWATCVTEKTERRGPGGNQSAPPHTDPGPAAGGHGYSEDEEPF